MDSKYGQLGRFLVIAAFLAALVAVGGEASAQSNCIDPLGQCTDPCPAANSCVFDSDCNAGSVCSSDGVPCGSSGCACDNGVWLCLPDCASQCVALEAVEVPAVSPWGLLGLGLSLSFASIVILARRRRRS